MLDSSIGHVQQRALEVLQQVFRVSGGGSGEESIVQPLIRIIADAGDAAPQAVEMLLPLARSAATATALADGGSVASLIALVQPGSPHASDRLRVQVFELLRAASAANSRCLGLLAQSAAPQLLLDVVGGAAVSTSSASASAAGAVGAHALTSAALLLMRDLCENNERLCASLRAVGGVEVLVACLQSAVPAACKEAAVDILSTICQADPSVRDVVAASGAAEAAIALLTSASPKAKAFIASLLNRPDVLQGTMATLRSNEPLLTLMVKSFVTELRADPTNHEPVCVFPSVACLTFGVVIERGDV